MLPPDLRKNCRLGSYDLGHKLIKKVLSCVID